jgi:GAF domain-containing protein/DNA-binding response OmpR family regulator/HPt (histidine-containing phosphotransfer) domain-containing protein
MADESQLLQEGQADHASALDAEVARLRAELAAERAQRGAIDEILRLIAQSSPDPAAILNGIAASAMRLCKADDALIWLVDGAEVVLGAHSGPVSAFSVGTRGLVSSLSRDAVASRAFLDGGVVHVGDVLGPEGNDYPTSRDRAQQEGARALLAVPLLREGHAIGVINLRRPEPRPFSEQQITLLQTFADQAVIAIENARLFSELQQRNADLADSLAQQQAIGKILQAITNSPTDVQPVFQIIADQAEQFLGTGMVGLSLLEGDAMVIKAWGPSMRQARAAGKSLVPSSFSLAEDNLPRLVFQAGRTVHYLTPEQHNDPTLGFGALLGTPLLQDGAVVGMLGAAHFDDKPFSEREITLFETFARQASIALANTRLFQQLQERNRELAAALEQQTATSQVLEVISRSPTNLQKVLDTIADSAARLCEADRGLIALVQGDYLRTVAGTTVDGERFTLKRPFQDIRLSRHESTGARAVIDKQVVHLVDLAAVPIEELAAEAQRRSGIRSYLVVPLIRQGDAIGVVALPRMEVRPFTERQIALVKTFADQAVIAIENSRLFSELQQRNADLAASLAQQQAISAIAQAITGSLTDVQPLLNLIAEQTEQILEGTHASLWLIDGDEAIRAAEGSRAAEVGKARQGALTVGTRLALVDSDAITQLIREGHTLRYVDVKEFQPQATDRSGVRSQISVAIRHEDTTLGMLLIWRLVVQPYTDREVALAETFANQVAVALANTRLFQQLQDRNRDLAESLDQQTAIRDILEVITSSPTDVQPVLDTVVSRAEGLLGNGTVALWLVEGDNVFMRAGGPRLRQRLTQDGLNVPIGMLDPLTRETVVGRATLEARTIDIPDMQSYVDPEYPTTFGEGFRQAGVRSLLGVPLIQSERAIGCMSVLRFEPHPFDNREITLLETFARQAAIAVANTNLFHELQDRNRELAKALERETATSEILRVISQSPTNLQPVLETIVANAAQLSGAMIAGIHQVHNDHLDLAADFGTASALREYLRRYPPQLTNDTASGRAALSRQVVYVPDVLADPQYARTDLPQVFGFRSSLSVPLVRENELLGVLSLIHPHADSFTPDQIKLIQTFADQAVIAMENTRLFGELQQRNADLAASLTQQQAISEIAQAIAGSLTDIQPLLDLIAERTEQLLEGAHVALWLVEGDEAVRAAEGPRSAAARTERGGKLPVGSRIATAGFIGLTRDDRGWHTHRNLDVREVNQEETDRTGARSQIVVPIVHEDNPLGFLPIWRVVFQPFTEREIALAETFANQIAVALANARLFQQLQERNASLREALEQQTATSDILRLISTSPTDLSATLQVIAERAARLCLADDALIQRVDGDQVVTAAHVGSIPGVEPGSSRLLERGSASGRAIIERRPIHIPDLAAKSDADYPTAKVMMRTTGTRTLLAVPLLREGSALGTIVIRRTEVNPFTDAQIVLLATFADQAVIAIENARLIGELQQRLEEQTATAEVLRVISESPTELQKVLDTIAVAAARLCNAGLAEIFHIQANRISLMAHYGALPGLPIGVYGVPTRSSLTARAWVDRKTIHVPDILALPADEFPGSREFFGRFGNRSGLSVPLLRGDSAVGVISIRRAEPGPFTEKQIKLLETFADQAAIAISNAELFQQLQDRTRELTESVERLRAVLEVGQAVSSTLDVETVLQTITARAISLSGANGGVLFELDPATNLLHLRTSNLLGEEMIRILQATPLHVGEGAAGRAIATRAPVQVADASAEGAYQSAVRDALVRAGFRALLAVPLLHEDQALGALALNRNTPGEFPPEVVELVKTFASQSAIALQNARLFQELEVKSRELVLASQHKSEFLATMSHELRTPLNAVIGMTGILLDTPLDTRQREYASIIRNSGEALLTIINDILDFSKIEAGKLDLELRPFDLRACVESALDLVTADAARKGLDLAYHLADDVPPAVVGDETRLRQVLLNLLNNAVKFTARGEVALFVDAPSAASASLPPTARPQLHFAVRDTGIGIPADRLDRLFQPFSQADASTTRKYGGTGLGLAVSRRLCELMGGTMWVESIAGQGSTFHFTIQAEPATAEHRSVERPHLASLDGKRLLVVDDNATNRQIVQLQARSWGMLPRETGAPREALEWIKRGDPFDVAILDMQMPGLDGVSLAHGIRAVRSAQALPLVLLSSLGRRETGAEPDLFAAVLTKPIKPSTLYDVLAGIFVGDALTPTLSHGERELVSPALSHGERRQAFQSSGGQPPLPAGEGRGEGLPDQPLAERHPLRILLAEDNSVNQQLALLLLGRLGYRADLAANGLEVLEAVERQPYDVILMDVQMPELDGLEASRRLCQHYPADRRPRIIAMTANAMQGDREMCLAAGMDDYLSKPIRPEELAGALGRARGTDLTRSRGDRGEGKRGEEEPQIFSAASAAPREMSRPAPATANNAPAIDRATFDRLRAMLAKAPPGALAHLIETFFGNAPTLIGQMKAGAETGSAEEVRRAAHTLKSNAANFGALSLAELCRALEMQARAGNLDGAAEQIVEIEARYAAAKQGLIDEIEGRAGTPSP